MEVLVSFFSVLVGLYVMKKLELSYKRVSILVLWPVPFFTWIMWISQDGSNLIDIAKVLLMVFSFLFVFAFPSLIAFALLVETAHKKNFIKSKFWFLLYAGFVGMVTFMFKVIDVTIDPFYYVGMFVLHACITFFVYTLPPYIKKHIS